MTDSAASGDLPGLTIHPVITDPNGQPVQAPVDTAFNPAQDLFTDEGFDPDTLANLAALSGIAHDEGSDLDADGEDVDEDEQEPSLAARVTREQVQGFVNGLSAQEKRGEIGNIEDVEGKDNDKDVDDREERDGTAEQGDERDSDDESKSGDEAEALRDPRYVFEGGRLKRKRNRTTLSCTECHRRKRKVLTTVISELIVPFSSPRSSEQCDRNIPCSRCIRRGVPSMCRMEVPILPQRKKRRLIEDVPINYELGIRVQALESLIRSGSSMDAEAASSVAMETILHATRAANSGSQDANNALAQLTQNTVGSMSQDDQSSLLMNVLQQLSAASSRRAVVQEHGDDIRTNNKDIWAAVPAAPAESSARIVSSYEEDTDAAKLNLSIRGFREDNGRIFIPPTVRYVEKNMRNENILAQEALGIGGNVQFLDYGVKFAYGADSPAYRHGRVAAIQAVSLTGGLRLAASFLARFSTPGSVRTIHVPSPTSAEDTTALRDAGMDVRPFNFLDRKNGGVDFEGVREDLLAAPLRSPVLLYISGSIPTGADFAAHQWRLLTKILQDRQLIPIVVMAFQGLSSGDTDRDAQHLRFMVHEGVPVVLIQSFDAMMGLYCDSPAIVSIIAQSADAKYRIETQLRSIARGMHSHPPPLGAHIVHAVLSDPKLLAEIKAMSDRLRSVRDKLHDVLANKLKTPGSWQHIKRSTGMFCSTLLSASQARSLASTRHIYLLPEGCFSLGCLNASKIDTLARGIDHVVREGIREAEEQAAQNIAMELALAAAKEQQAREEAEEAAAAAREEDTLLMERSIANAMEAQKRAEDDEQRRHEETRDLEESLRKAAGRAEIARQAEAILATIQANG